MVTWPTNAPRNLATVEEDTVQAKTEDAAVDAMDAVEELALF